MTRLRDLRFSDMRYLGSAFFWGCNLICFQSTMLFAPSGSALMQSTSFLFLSIVMTIITRFLAALVVARRPSIVGPVAAIAFATVDSCGLLAMVIALYLTQMAPALYVTGAVLIGIGSGWLDALWLHVYGGLRPENTSALIPLATFCGTIVYFVGALISFSSPMAGVWFAFVLPLLSGVLLASCLRKLKIPLATDTAQAYRSVASSLWKAVVGAAIFCLITGMVAQMSAWRAASFNDMQTTSLIVSGLLSLLLFLVVVLFKRRFDLSNAYRIAVPFLLIGCLLLPLMWGGDTVWASVLVSAGSTLFDLVVMCLIAEASYDYKVSGAVVGGIARGITIAISAFGTLLGFFFNRYVTLGTLEIIAISIAAIYLLAMGVVLTAKRRNAPAVDVTDEGTAAPGTSVPPAALSAGASSGVSADTAGAAEASARLDQGLEANEILDSNINRISDEYHLSRREAEIFSYVARGRSAVYIADILFVSENTIRSHMRRIYEKLGVHSKQELLDLVEKELSEKDA